MRALNQGDFDTGRINTIEDRDFIYYTLGRNGSPDLNSFCGMNDYLRSTIQEMEPDIG